MDSVYFSFDLEELGMLPGDWVEQIERISRQNAEHVFLDGKSSTSREPDDSAGTEYHVVTGNVVFEKLNWLYRLYASHLVALAVKATGKTVMISPEINSAININVLEGAKARYEWHVDSNPLTGLLFVTSHSEEAGGQLVFRLPSEDISVYPKRGTFLLFDARKIPHTVMPLKYPHRRISIPMNYYTPEHTFEDVRPTDLDTYIYSS